MEAEQEQQLQELQDAWLQMKEQPRRKRARKAKPQETSLPPSQAEPDDVARSGNERIYLAFIAFLFDPGWMAQDHRAPDRDRLLAARLDGVALRHARWGGLTEDEKAAGAAELGKVAGDRADLLAEVAGLSLGTAEGKGREYTARAQAIAELCRLAGADKDQIPQWIEGGRRRVAIRRKPPFSDPAPRTPRRQ